MSNRLSFLASKPIIVTAAIVIIGALGVTALELTNTTHFFHKAPTPKPAPTLSTADSPTKGEPQSSNQGTPAVPPSQAGASKSSGNSGAVLEVPTGTFVSNHRPNLSGSPAPNAMASSCATTPGATCQIIFTQGGVTKSLDARLTDSTGSAYWSWKLQDIGLTQGTWKIEAKAVLNDQSKTAYDSLDLEVGP